jgi:WD40-like Beta Propeller Repeat
VIDASTARARSSVLFDWIMGFLSVLLMGGLLLDGWAHSHGEVDQSFVTPWHALLYGSMGVNGLVLLGAGIAGLRKGYRFRDALPPGYWGAAIGVVIFVVGGGFDGWWHTRFGIENGIVLLVSPPHLILALAAALIFSGPLFSIGAQYGRDAGGWKRIGPAVLSTWALITLVGFFLAYAQPIEDGLTSAAIGPNTGETVYPNAYVVDTKGALTRISTPPKADLSLLAVSPDGRHIVYRVNRYHDEDSTPPSDVFVANIDGSKPVRLTNSGNHDTQPQWSPDGKWLAYDSDPAGTSGQFAIHVIHPDGTADATLLSQDTTISDLSWSPDGRSIAYASRNGTTGMVGVIDVASKQTHWLPFTANGSSPVWTSEAMYFLAADNAIHAASIDGGNARKIPHASNQTPAVSRDGRQIAYVSNDLGSDQVFVSDADGSKARDLSQLSGLNVTSVAWTPDGRIAFTAVGRPSQAHFGAGPTVALTALILEGILLAGGVLLLVRRWNVPLGAITLLLTFFSLSMAVQSDLYVEAIAGLVTGLAADVAIATLRERIREGRFFYALGFVVPALFTSLYLIITVQAAGGQSGWVWNLLLGAPMLAGSAGLFLAYCFDSPLKPASSLAISTVENPR